MELVSSQCIHLSYLRLIHLLPRPRSLLHRRRTVVVVFPRAYIKTLSADYAYCTPVFRPYACGKYEPRASLARSAEENAFSPGGKLFKNLQAPRSTSGCSSLRNLGKLPFRLKHFGERPMRSRGKVGNVYLRQRPCFRSCPWKADPWSQVEIDTCGISDRKKRGAEPTRKIVVDLVRRMAPATLAANDCRLPRP